MGNNVFSIIIYDVGESVNLQSLRYLDCKWRIIINWIL